MPKITVPEAMRQLLTVTKQLVEAYPHKKFTLDGRLVGDIGEVLCEEVYDLQLYQDVKAKYDGETSCGWLVQVKATMRNSLTFPAHHVPDYFLGVLLKADGTFEEIFNGPGWIAAKAIANREPPKKSSLHSVTLSSLRELQRQVAKQDRIPFRQAPAALAA